MIRTITACLAVSWIQVAVPLYAAEPSVAVQSLLKDRCADCHNADLKNGGLDIARLLAASNVADESAHWIKIETAITKGNMPPADEQQLTAQQIQVFGSWFEQQFVLPGGIQQAGPGYPRRLTREELQNTLEDILQVNIRETVTNSRLHVIPDTIIEKFFTSGVIGESGFSNDAVTLSKESIDIQTYARCFALVISLLDANEQARTSLFGTKSIPNDLTVNAAHDIIAKFGKSAFRRPLTNVELDAVVAVYQKMSARKSPSDGIKSSFLAILLSPTFLYRFEEPVQVQTRVTGYELAVRLSYFLWSSPPDQTLLELAESGELRKPEVIRQQVRRMLSDPRRVALAENLGGEWFGFKKLRQQSAVNKRSDKMAGFYRTQFEEALLFFDSVIRFDQPIFSLVDADWAYLNRHQSGIYGVSTQNKTFDEKTAFPAVNIHYRDANRKIAQGNYEYKHAPLGLAKLTDPNLGGFITLGPTMSVTSTENRTSPIRRGVWVMERILGEHFKVPEDVPDLEATQKKVASKNLSHTELLKLHSSQPGCAACHKYIDPIGFGLEVFDQLGVQRGVAQVNHGGEQLSWTPKLTHRRYADRVWNLKEPIDAGVTYNVHFQYTKGRHRLNIRNVRLEAGDVRLTDKHFGFTGGARQDNVWRFVIPKDAPATGWKMTAEIEGDGGTDSHGTISVSGPGDKGEGFQLPNGSEFSSPAELKQSLLANYREQIVDNAVRRVLAYALGRKTLPIDRPAIKQIKQKLAEQEFRMPALIEAVALSYPFLHKGN